MKRTNKLIIALVAITVGSQIQAMASEAGVAARRGAAAGRRRFTTQTPTTAGRAARSGMAPEAEVEAIQVRRYQGPAVSRQRMGESLRTEQTGMGLMQPTAQPGVVTRGSLAETLQIRAARRSLGLEKLAEWKDGGMEYGTIPRDHSLASKEQIERREAIVDQFQADIPEYAQELRARSNALGILKDELQKLTSDNLKGSIKAEIAIKNLSYSRRETAMAALQDVLNGKIDGSQAAEIIQLQKEDIDTQLENYEKAVKLGIASYDQLNDKYSYFSHIKSLAGLSIPDTYGDSLFELNHCLLLIDQKDVNVEAFISSRLPQLIKEVEYMNAVVDTLVEMAEKTKSSKKQALEQQGAWFD